MISSYLYLVLYNNNFGFELNVKDINNNNVCCVIQTLSDWDERGRVEGMDEVSGCHKCDDCSNTHELHSWKCDLTRLCREVSTVNPFSVKAAKFRKCVRL